MHDGMGHMTHTSLHHTHQPLEPCPPATMHAPLQPRTHSYNHTQPPATTHAPLMQPCMPPCNHTCPPCNHTHPPCNHAHPPATMHAPPATMHAPCNQTCPPFQPHMPPNHAHTPATMHAPPLQPCTPPCNHVCPPNTGKLQFNCRNTFLTCFFLDLHRQLSFNVILS